MKKLFYLFILFSMSLNAQIINLKILDFDNLPLDDADIYFKTSTKNFISDMEGKAIVDLANVSGNDELIISKKDYQDAIIKVSELKSNLNVKLEKVSEIELKEAFVSNLKSEDILKKVIDNYEKNYNVEKYYYLVDFKQNVVYDSLEREYINLDLEFKFNKDNLKIKSNKEPKEIIDVERDRKVNIILNNYLKNISIIENLKNMFNNVIEKKYAVNKLSVSQYSDNTVYVITLENETKQNLLTIDKSTYAVIDYTSKVFEEKDKYSGLSEISYKFRPYQDKWILKESSVFSKLDVDLGEKTNVVIDIKLQVGDFNLKSFNGFNRTINPYKNIRSNFK
ncbi:hypothetical protein [Algoriella sp.]|uniref:hypothetical protein n=3 Tax=Algoriella sp. TaxID=1872434 RepID=UPI002FC75454